MEQLNIHKFQNLEDITVANLKFRPIRLKHLCTVWQVISDYLRPLCKNEYFINGTQKISSMLSLIPPLQDDEKDVLYV